MYKTEFSWGGLTEDLLTASLIRHQNKEKRLDWAHTYLCDTLDEMTIQLESHRHYCNQKDGEKARLKLHPKHPIYNYDKQARKGKLKSKG